MMKKTCYRILASILFLAVPAAAATEPATDGELAPESSCDACHSELADEASAYLRAWSRDVHREVGFDASTFVIEAQFLDGGEGELGKVEYVLVNVPSGGDATNESQWSAISNSGGAPTGTQKIRLRASFSGTSDVGGLQGARMDNFTLSCSDD